MLKVLCFRYTACSYVVIVLVVVVVLAVVLAVVLIVVLVLDPFGIVLQKLRSYQSTFTPLNFSQKTSKANLTGAINQVKMIYPIAA